MKRVFAILAVLSLGVAGWSATFSANGGAGTSTIGVGGDYPSLEAAAGDFNGATPVTGDYTFLITSDLTETTNVAFGKNTEGHSVTLRPAPATTPKVTFTDMNKNIGWDAHLAIGTVSTQIAGDYLTTTSNFVVDGCNTPGGVSRDLTLTNVQLPLSTTPSLMLRVVGGCDGVQVRNLVIDNLSSSTADCVGVEYTSRHTTLAPLGVGDYIPKNGLVDNCAITCQYGGNAKAIQCRNSNTIASGLAQTGMVFTRNELNACYQCIDLNQNADVQITSNTFVCDFDPAFRGTRPEVVRHQTCNGTTGWTVNVIANKWLHTRGNQSGNSGLNNCLNVGAGLTSPRVGTYNIFNNTFGGFDCTGVVESDPTHGPAGGLYHCFVMGFNNCTAIINFCHNSINMQNQGGMVSAGLWERYGPIALSGTGWAGTFNMYNNIIRAEQNNGVLIYRYTGGAGTINSDYNVFWLGSYGAQMASINLAQGVAPNYPTFDTWRSAGNDRHSVLINPTVSNGLNPGKWVLGALENDLHFDAQPSDLFGCLPYPGVTQDIDGDLRSTTVVYKGADERSEQLQLPSTGARDWSLYN